MNKRIKQLADQAANEIADQFSPGFFDDRMVEDVSSIISKHYDDDQLLAKINRLQQTVDTILTTMEIRSAIGPTLSMAIDYEKERAKKRIEIRSKELAISTEYLEITQRLRELETDYPHLKQR